jgi:uncharacterized protein
VELTVGGQRLALLAERAAFLTAQGLLLVADAHIGKAASFRKLGVPVPEATTQGTLDRLSAALSKTGAAGIVFLGDLLHSARAHNSTTLAAVQAWRDAHRDVELTLVRGNHDSHAGDPPAAWGVRCLDGPLLLSGLALDHEPRAHAGHYTLAGHVHPACVVSGRGPGALRLPCFHFGPEVGVLPAFGEFTGAAVLPRGPGTRVFAIADDAVRELPAVRARAPGSRA